MFTFIFCKISLRFNDQFFINCQCPYEPQIRPDNWLGSFSPKLTYFNVSRNKIRCTIPDLSSNFFGMIDVSSNNFSGPLPLLHGNVSLAHFSQNMF